MTDVQLEQILVIKKDLDVAAKTMIEAAKKAGGHDNVSVSLIRVRSRGGANGVVPRASVPTTLRNSWLVDGISLLRSSG